MKKICVVCGNEFECYNKAGGHGHCGYKRPSNCITCSPRCSRKWNNLRSNLRAKRRRDEKWKKE